MKKKNQQDSHLEKRLSWDEFFSAEPAFDSQFLANREDDFSQEREVDTSGFCGRNKVGSDET